MSPINLRALGISAALMAVFAPAGCAPIRTFPVPAGIEKLEPGRTPLPSDRMFRRNRKRDQKRRLDASRRRSRIGGRKIVR